MANGYKKGVDPDVNKIKRFLSALQKKKQKKKVPQEQAPQAPQEDKFASLVNQYRQKAQQAAAQEDIIAKNMLYSQAVGANPAPGVVPAALLGFNQADPERGAPMGVDVSQMSPEDRARVLERVPVDQQEELARRWQARLKGGNQ